MKRGYNRFFIRIVDGAVNSYIYVDTSKTTPTRYDKNMFDDTVEFNVNSRRGGGGLANNYPVIFEDFTSPDGATYEEVTFNDIPAPIKRRYTRWEKLQ